MNLYSQEETRVRKAIRDLWTAWDESDGSLNNLRIFASGEMVKPTHVCISRIMNQPKLSRRPGLV